MMLQARCREIPQLGGCQFPRMRQEAHRARRHSGHLGVQQQIVQRSGGPQSPRTVCLCTAIDSESYRNICVEVVVTLSMGQHR